MRKIQKIQMGMAALLALPLIAAGPALAQSDAMTPAADGPCSGMSINIAQANPGYPRLPVYVALYGGYFAKTGLDVTVAEANSGADATAALVGRSADINAGTFSDVLLARSKGAPVLAFAATGYQEISNLVMKKSAMKEKGITAESSPEEKIKALKGLRIGVTSPGSSTDLLVRAILIQQGLDPDTDVRIIPVGASAIAPAFSRDQLDAFALSSPSANAAANIGDGQVVLNFSTRDYPEVADTLFMTMNTSESAVQDKKKELSCFRNGIEGALEVMKSDPKKATEYAWKEFDGVVKREAFDATIGDNISAFADSTKITEDDAKKRQDIIALVVPDVGKIDVSKTFTTNLE